MFFLHCVTVPTCQESVSKQPLGLYCSILKESPSSASLRVCDRNNGTPTEVFFPCTNYVSVLFRRNLGYQESHREGPVQHMVVV